MSLKAGQLSKIVLKSLGDINKKFRQEIKLIDLPRLIKDLILKGISPVAGAIGRFQKYSESYIEQITGKAAFFKKNGKLIVVKSNDPAASKAQNKSNKSFVSKVTKSKFKDKRRSPVNLKLSGEMLDSLTFNPNSGILKADDFKWDLHNNGEGNLPERRLLPDRENESFNRRVQQKITEALIKAIGLKKAKKFLTINFKIK
jgi:histone H3/H4